MKLANRNNKITIKDSKNIILYQLPICKQKTTNATFFQAYFGNKANTPLSNIITDPKYSNLSYENVLKFCLDADKVPVEDYLEDKGWVTVERSKKKL